MTRAAVIGLGAIGRHHARVYNDLESVELVAVADPDESRRLAVARRFKVPAYADAEELLAREEVDAASIAVPTALHRKLALATIEHGVHLLVEKPIAATVEEGQEIIDRAEAAGLVLAVGHVERFNPAVVELKRRLDDGVLGHVFHIQARRLSPFPDYVRDAGVVLDLATHELDVMWYLMESEIERVYAEAERNVHKMHEDLLSGIVRFRNGVVGVLDINWLTPTKVRDLRVTGERGMFVLDYLNQDLFFYENSQAPSRWDTIALFKGVDEGNLLRIRVDKREPLEAELAAFAQAVATRSRPCVTGADGLRAVELARLLLASAEQGQVLHLENAAGHHAVEAALGGA